MHETDIHVVRLDEVTCVVRIQQRQKLLYRTVCTNHLYQDERGHHVRDEAVKVAGITHGRRIKLTDCTKRERERRTAGV